MQDNRSSEESVVLNLEIYTKNKLSKPSIERNSDLPSKERNIFEKILEKKCTTINP